MNHRPNRSSSIRLHVGTRITDQLSQLVCDCPPDPTLVICQSESITVIKPHCPPDKTKLIHLWFNIHVWSRPFTYNETALRGDIWIKLWWSICWYACHVCRSGDNDVENASVWEDPDDGAIGGNNTACTTGLRYQPQTVYHSCTTLHTVSPIT